VGLPFCVAITHHRHVYRDTALLDPDHLDLATLIERHHDLVLELALLDGPQDTAGSQAGADLHLGDERPFLVLVQRIHRDAARQEGAMTRGDILQRVLQTIVDLAQQARA